MTRHSSSNTISFSLSIELKHLAYVLKIISNNVSHIFTNIKYTKSLIDQFILSESLSHLVIDYYTLHSMYNLCGHIPLLCILYCNVDRVISIDNFNTNLKLRWDSVTDELTKYYKSCLNHIFQLFTISCTVMDCNTNYECLHEHNITLFHNNIATPLTNSLNFDIKCKNPIQLKRKAISGGSSELDVACENSLLLHYILVECIRMLIVCLAT